MSYVECPDCGKRIEAFGSSKIASVAAQNNIATYATMPINPAFATAVDRGDIESFSGTWLDGISSMIQAL
jgi:hypothetical protein